MTTQTFAFIQCRFCRINWDKGEAFSPESLAAVAASRAHAAEHHAGKRALVFRVVNGKVSDKIKCGGRCLTATGPDCDCSCGGAHHGRHAVG